MNSLRFTLTVFASLAALTLATPAAASDSAPPRTTASSTSATNGLMAEAQRWLTAATLGPTVASEPSTNTSAATAERAAPARFGAEQTQPLFDLSPHASLVARDWHGSMRLIGNRSMLVDDLRPTATNRMVVARLATDARFSGFVQAGIGEWRIDTVMFPSARSDSEIAGALGAGFELHLPHGIKVAGEAQYTMLYRDLHYSADEAAPRIASVVLAIAGRF